jgi:large subunit ribosomal protein L30
MKDKKVGKIKITQVRSVINRLPDQKKTITALGLRRIRHSVIKDATPQILGMVNKVKHLVQTEEVK